MQKYYIILFLNRYIIKLVPDGKYGAPDEDGQWNGMVDELIQGVCCFNVYDTFTIPLLPHKLY